MWAMVNNNQVTAIYPRPKAITIDGIQHPAAIFTAWSKAEQTAKGIFEYIEVNALCLEALDFFNQQRYPQAEMKLLQSFAALKELNRNENDQAYMNKLYEHETLYSWLQKGN